jgi:hypothetical protein
MLGHPGLSKICNLSQMKKKFIVLLLFFLTADALPADKARGFFLAIGVGPRLPVSSFSNQSDLGYGFNLEISYTDNEYLPVFLFAKAGFEQYPGSPDFYQSSDYTNFSTTTFPINAGVRHYFPPIVENVVLLIPIVEVSAVYTFFSRLHQFKAVSGRNNYTEEMSKLGINAGAGFSMFLMELLFTYTYFETIQYVSLDIKIRLPLFINY